MRRSVLCILVLAFALTASTTVVSAQSAPTFQLGFKALADQIPDIVGTPVETEHWGSNGDSLQHTTTGLMVWRKLDNWTAFTNGSTTWINGPYGIQSRLNDDAFPWEVATNTDGTRQSPMPLDQSLIGGGNNGQPTFRIRVVNVNHNATAAAMAVNPFFNTAPPPGYTYVAVEIALTYVKGDVNKGYRTSDSNYLLEASNQFWRASIFSQPTQPQFRYQDILPGATVTGWLLPILVPTNLADSVVLYNSEYNWYFALK